MGVEIMEEVYWYECFITRNTEFCLIDGSGDIRATAPDLQGILVAQEHYGWGTIRYCSYKTGTLEVGEIVKGTEILE